MINYSNDAEAAHAPRNCSFGNFLLQPFVQWHKNFLNFIIRNEWLWLQNENNKEFQRSEYVYIYQNS